MKKSLLIFLAFSLMLTLGLCFKQSPAHATGQTNNATTTNIIMYDLSKAPQGLHGMQVPDFLAFATKNKEKTPLTAIGNSFTPGIENTIAFDLGEEYVQAYWQELEHYIYLLEKQGFKYRANWEGYHHLEKKVDTGYLQLTVGIYGYETSGLLVSIALDSDSASYPPHFPTSYDFSEEE